MGKIQLTRKVMNFLVWLLLDSSKGSHKSKQECYLRWEPRQMDNWSSGPLFAHLIFKMIDLIQVIAGQIL
uniref:Uncharacterized protein n=1 Tax=Salix viminalis TaxID=40686 RepID=A0A6N2LLK0_SALVM